jgi:hypothetical protein
MTASGVQVCLPNERDEKVSRPRPSSLYRSRLLQPPRRDNPVEHSL